MTPPTSPSLAKPPGLRLMLGGLFLVVLALRWQWISEFCGQLPFWDEWLDDAPLFRAAQLGALTWEQLFAPFNGHRHFFQRLVKLVCFWGNDRQWDSQMQSTLNAAFGAAIPVTLAAILGRRGERVNYAVWAAIGLIWGSATLWYNATWAFQLAPVFMILVVVGGGALVLEGGSRWKATGFVLLAAALLTQASGFLGALAMVVSVGLVAARERSLPRQGKVSLGVCGTIAVMGLALQLGAGGAPDGFQARSITDFLLALAANLSWPLALEAPDGSVYYIGILLWVPAPLLLALWFFRRGGLVNLDLPRGRWELLLALTIWVYSQLAMIALMRGVDGRGPSWRHYEFHAVGIVLNVAALTLLWEAWPARRRMLLGAAAGFAGLLVAGVAMQWNLAKQVLEVRRKVNMAQENTVREYLATRDAAKLRGRAIFETPFLFLDRPDEVLDDPVIQDMLPACVGIQRTITPPRSMWRSRQRFSGTQVPPLAAKKMQFAEVWSSWPPHAIALDEPLNAVLLLDEKRKARFAWQQLYYLGDPGSSGENGISTLHEKTRGKFTQPFHYRTALETNPRFDWTPLLMPYTSLRVDQAKPEAWLVFTEPQGLGRLSYWTERARSGATVLILMGVIALFAGMALAQGWIRPPRLPRPGRG